MQNTQTAKRLNITISQDTWQKIKVVAPKMERSRFIDNALKVYLAKSKANDLKRKLKEEALGNKDKDLEIANEWFALDQESWDSIK